ncbi:MAG: type ISP restriction/modification enzyme [Methylocystis sp.]
MAYVDNIISLHKSGRATEHSYRPALKEYLEKLLPNIIATNEPKRQKCGAPDYIITRNTRGNSIPIGFIEAKDIGIDLNKVEKNEQIARYKESLDNLILTDYLDFRFFKEGEKVAEVKIASFEHGKITPLPANIKVLETLLADFAAFQGQTITSAKNLAVMMARKAKLMQEVFCKAVTQQEEHSGLNEQLEAFRRILIHDMQPAEFADVYAQTITYGLFTARLHEVTASKFSRMEALNLIPMSNPFLRKLFQYVAVELDDSIAWIVDALCEVLRATDIQDVMADFGKQAGRNDPIVHFYETFLAEYNPKLRKSRGVFYTPEPVVNFIIRAVDDCLKTYFSLPAGLADTGKVKIKIDAQAFDKRTKSGKALVEKEVHKVQLLDVASGTGTFIAEVIKQIYNSHFQHQQGMWSNYVEEHLLPRLHGFEILMASYAMCHLKIELLLNETGYRPKDPKRPTRLGVYLTNSLEEAHPDAETLFASWLSAEANEANVVKRNTPVMVAFGNPPYNSSSQNKSEWILSLTADYKKHLNEQNINSLSDDYIKFIRYAEYHIEKTGYGIVAMITNNSFLDGITHRQMRKHLLETFDTIYIYDLHGSSKKRETTADGGADKNVFDIQQGVSIGIFVKHKDGKNRLADVWHYDSYGTREAKYAELWENSIKNTGFHKITYKEPYYFFVQKDFKDSAVYNNGFGIAELFDENGSGVKFRKDNLLVRRHFSKGSVIEMLMDINSKDKYYILSKYEFSETSDWQFDEQKTYFKTYADSDIRAVAYRPFDVRYTYYPIEYISKIIPRGDSRKALMQHMIKGGNFGLMCSKQANLGFKHSLITNTIVDMNLLATAGLFGCGMIFPLYLYPAKDKQLLLGGAQHRKPNFDMEIVATIGKKLGIHFVPDHEDKKADGKTVFSPLDLLDYVYAVLHSPTYRETYKEFLKIDFPRIPYPDDAKAFWQLVALGREIRLLHLLESPMLSKFTASYPVSGDNAVEKIDYEGGRVYINKDQYFAGVPEVAWSFYIGGYQPAQKWLKDRKGRQLNFDDITHYLKIIVALTETERLMRKIDTLWKP